MSKWQAANLIPWLIALHINNKNMKKQDLIKLSQDTFFENNEGLISPDGHRKYNEAIIGAMGMDEDVQQLVKPKTPKHAQPLVVNEVVGRGKASWDRAHNHVVYLMESTDFPIGEVVFNFYQHPAGFGMGARSYGPAVKVENDKYFFEVTEPGEYLLYKKNGGRRGGSSYKITEAEAAAGYRIYFDDITVNPAGRGKENRAYARLYYMTSGKYQKKSYLLLTGTYKYTTDGGRFEFAEVGGPDVGIAVESIKAKAPVITRQGKFLPEPIVTRPELILRPTFSISANNLVTLDQFIEPGAEADMENHYAVWYKKSRSWWYYLLGQRKTHHMVGYTKASDLPITDLVLHSKLGHGGSVFGNVPRYIDFQIRMKNAEKTVVAKYRATQIIQNDIERRFLFRKQ